MAEKKGRTVPTAYGLWVFNRLREEGMTLNALAEHIGVKRQNLSNHLYGRKPSPGYQPKIEKVLGKAPSTTEGPPSKLAG